MTLTVRETMFTLFWKIVPLGLAFFGALFGTHWLEPQRYAESGIDAYFLVLLWVAICWAISKRFELLGAMMFSLSMIPFLFAVTSPVNSLFRELALQPATRLALTGPFILAIAVQGGFRWTLVAFAVTVLTFWGNPLLQLSVTGHQLVLYGIFGNVVHQLIIELERQRHEVSATNVQLEEIALHDAITGFYNRHALHQRFNDPEFSIGAYQILASWDLDGLKIVNDTQGHIAGDRYLQNFSAALRAACGAEDQLYRIGGDEFVSLHADCKDLSRIAERTRASFPNVSVGWVTVTQRDLDAMLVKADGLMYADKNARRTRVTQSQSGVV